MTRLYTVAALALTVCSVSAHFGSDQTVIPVRAGAEATGPLVTTDPDLRAGLNRIALGSPLWRNAIDRLQEKSGRVIVLTAEQFASQNRRSLAVDSFDPSLVAEAAPVLSATGRVGLVIVVVNVSLLKSAHEGRNSLLAELHTDLDRILIHEIYGHAVPYLLAGDISGRCADPEPHERAADACAIRRENAVRAELGLGRRVDAGLEGLTLSRRDRQ